MIFLLIVCTLLAVIFAGGYYAYHTAFFSSGRARDDRHSDRDNGSLGSEVGQWIRQLRDRPCEPVSIRSFDGLELFGRYYPLHDGAPLFIGFHGYHSSSFVDFSGGSQLIDQLGCNLLLVDQRAHGKSGGHTITFGIKERWDVVEWVRYALERFGPETKIILMGVSMGAATVLMASDLDLPDNVRGIIADCPYSSPKAIIRKVAKQRGIPDGLAWPFVKIGAKVYGGFDIDETDAARAVKAAQTPILILHGEADGFVPCEMSDLTAENPARVTRHTFPNADHGLSFLTDSNRYRQLVTEFVCNVLLERNKHSENR